MSQLTYRADAMLTSPLACAFLVAANDSGLAPAGIAAPRNSLRLCARALAHVDVWQTDYRATRDAVLRAGRRLRGLALAILRQPRASGWFGPLDVERQVFVSRDGRPPEQRRFVAVKPPLTDWERYAGKSRNGLFTTTMADGAEGMTSLLAAIEEGAGDVSVGYQVPPACWWLKPAASVKVYEIDGAMAWHELCARYPSVGKSDSATPDFSQDDGRLTPDWPAVAIDWDAVHMSLGGLLLSEQVRVESGVGWTYQWSWNIEQTMWLRWTFKEARQLPDCMMQLASRSTEASQ